MELQNDVLIKIGGENGNVAGVKVLEPVIFSLIAPAFLSETSWTGRAGKGQPNKIALKKYGRVVSMITSICNKADKFYGADTCLKDLKYKVIKYANKLAESNRSESESSPAVNETQSYVAKKRKTSCFCF